MSTDDKQGEARFWRIRFTRQEGRSGVVGVTQGTGVLDQALDAVQDHRFEQGFLGREVPVHSSCADSGAPRDLVQWHGHALGRERGPRRFQHPCPIFARVGTQRLAVAGRLHGEPSHALANGALVSYIGVGRRPQRREPVK